MDHAAVIFFFFADRTVQQVAKVIGQISVDAGDQRVARKIAVTAEVDLAQQEITDKQAELEDNQLKLSETQKTLEEKVPELEEKQKSLADKKAELDKERNQANNLLASLNKQTGNYS
mgnify:CR=1 FL=1